jgi:hypothetical protein
MVFMFRACRLGMPLTSLKVFLLGKQNRDTPRGGGVEGRSPCYCRDHWRVSMVVGGHGCRKMRGHRCPVLSFMQCSTARAIVVLLALLQCFNFFEVLRCSHCCSSPVSLSILPSLLLLLSLCPGHCRISSGWCLYAWPVAVAEAKGLECSDVEQYLCMRTSQ